VASEIAVKQKCSGFTAIEWIFSEKLR